MNDKILCSCKRCGIGYTQWIAHGELPSSRSSRCDNQHNTLGGDDMQGLVHEAFGVPNEDGYTDEHTRSQIDAEIANGQSREFYKLIDGSQQPLFERCDKFSKLSFIIRLLHLKCIGSLNNKVFDMLLELLREAFPDAMVDLPKSYYEAEKLMKGLGLDADPTGEKRKIAQNVLWYFPVKPRLQRLFMSTKTASDMRWHAENLTKDGYMRHPADSSAWNTFDTLHPSFAQESRNVRLGLESDGINPFKNMTPGNNIDIYLQPLIADLKDLWEVGVETYDASKKQNFQLHASLIWTISDFPGYAYLSGWSTQGEFACPVCNKETHSLRLKHGGKYCYMGHRRFLPKEHEFRKNRRLFDGTVEYGEAPQRQSGNMVMDELKDFTVKFGKQVKGNPKLFGWKKKSIFFELSYWKDNVVRHNLDVMHTEKNICESICGTLLDLDGKSKDNYKSRQDLEQMGIRPELHPISKGPGKIYLPAAAFTMSKMERTTFCRLLPIALRNTLSKSVRAPLIKLSEYFRELCSKVIHPADVIRLEKDIVVVLCQLEKIFPPSFFDVMVHLTVHLATEVKYLGTLKSYVWNRSKPEGSIARGYLAEECLTFCSLYLAGCVESKFNQPSRNETVNDNAIIGLDVFTIIGHSLGKGTAMRLDDETLTKAHQYVLFNSEAVRPYIEQHWAIVEQSNPRVARHQLERIHSESFADWFAQYVERLIIHGETPTLRDLKLVARQPNFIGVKYKKYIVNGFRFHTKDLENIIELDYGSGRRVVLFDCEWVSKESGDFGWVRDDVDGTKVDISVQNQL
ncbi:uncharacterized protein LOC125195243 [Salvia hispanica]|uniref:uncharacterized protein LOC125195243 n=1 Tax=Salvia hispanica TaxID=49212 RepID=UPI002009C37F|nr:uncharacterized protein LOC125195243 [Salvia hispanica]